MSAPEATAIYGLPGPLPEGETLVWQGAPDFWSCALRVFHLRKLAGYFGVLLAWLVGAAAWEGQPMREAAAAIGLALPLSLACLGILAALAWLTSRTTLYTITDKRVVMRFGIALPVSLNIPFRVVESAALKMHADGTGDLPLMLKADVKAAYLMLWPHARAWKVSRPEPTLRSVPDAARVATTLSRALAAAAGQPYPRGINATGQDPLSAAPPRAGIAAAGQARTA